MFLLWVVCHYIALTFVVVVLDLYNILLPQYGHLTLLPIISSEIFLWHEKQVYFTIYASSSASSVVCSCAASGIICSVSVCRLIVCSKKYALPVNFDLHLLHS